MTLANFRSCRSAELQLKRGAVLLQGAPQQGAEDLLEAAYMLSLAKPSVADRELVHPDIAAGGTALIEGVCQARAFTSKAQISIAVAISAEGQASTQKGLSINGVKCTASEFVGNIKAVRFMAEDAAILTGPPAQRRRYLDILISQTDREYLKGLQRYNKVLQQRNGLLRQILARKAAAAELKFWDERLVYEATWVMVKRFEVAQQLAQIAQDTCAGLLDAGPLRIAYRPGLSSSLSGAMSSARYKKAVTRALEAEIRRSRSARPLRSQTVTGPHRDELALSAGQQPAAKLPPDQVALLALALKACAAEQIAAASRDRPILILDRMPQDLDEPRREWLQGVLERHDQALIGVAPEDRHRPNAAVQFSVAAGSVSPLAA